MYYFFGVANTESDGTVDQHEELQDRNPDEPRDNAAVLGDLGGGPGGSEQDENNDNNAAPGDSDEERPYDISIAASHSVSTILLRENH